MHSEDLPKDTTYPKEGSETRFGSLKPVIIKNPQTVLIPIDPVKAQQRAMKDRQRKRHEKNKKLASKYPLKRKLTGLVLPLKNFDTPGEEGPCCEGGSTAGDLRQEQKQKRGWKRKPVDARCPKCHRPAPEGFCVVHAEVTPTYERFKVPFHLEVGQRRP